MNNSVGVLTPTLLWGYNITSVMTPKEKPMNTSKKLVQTSLLIALGVIIPMMMPKIDTGVASYTLGSHVPVMVAMFISPTVTILVAIGGAISYLLTSTYIVSLRALSHIVFAVIGSLMIQKNRDIIKTQKDEFKFNAFIGLIHVVMESLVVAIILSTQGTNPKELFLLVFVAIGLGGFVHSFADFFITSKIVKSLKLLK